MVSKSTLLNIIILITGLAWIYLSAVPNGDTTGGLIPAPHPGFLAPEFILKDAAGNETSLSNYRGKAVVVNFWASWCTPCKAEMPTLEAIHQEYLTQDVVILAINATSQDSKANALNFIEENDLTFPVLFDETGEVNRLYAVQALPTTFFIRPDGVINEVVVGGPMQDALLRDRIDELFQEK